MFGSARDAIQIGRSSEVCAALPGDILEFAGRVGFHADEIQSALLNAAGRRVILNCTRQWGKSTVTAVRAVWEAYSNPYSLTLVVSKSMRQTSEFMKKAAGFVRQLGIQRRRDPDNPVSILMPNGSRIIGAPSCEENVRGFSAVSLLIIDEAARVPDDAYDAVVPMLAVSKGKLWLLSTPWSKRGFFYEEWTNGGEQWHRVMAPATECARIPAEFLEEERKRKSKERFRREYLCEFTKGEGMLFDRDLLDQCFKDDRAVLGW